MAARPRRRPWWLAVAIAAAHSAAAENTAGQDLPGLGRAAEQGAAEDAEHAGTPQVRAAAQLESQGKARPGAVAASGVANQRRTALQWWRGSARRRRLEGTGSSTGSSGGIESVGGEEENYVDPSFCLYFLLDMIMAGALAQQLTMVPAFKSVQFTVLLFVLGIAYAIVHECHPSVKEFRGAYYASYMMWMRIPSQVLMWVFLPPLIMCDSMTADIPLAGRVYKQVLWLAGPFVIMNTLFLAPLLHLVVGWNAFLSVAAAAMLGSTDPVAVVALLKQLGAHPVLTVLIQGESLMNDGSSIIMFNLALGVLRETHSLTTFSVLLELVLKCVGSTALGLAIGFVFARWIQAASMRYSDQSDSIQMSLTLVASYCGWIVAEGVFQGSGVICTVSVGFVLADSMWSRIVHPESLTACWGCIEFVFNSTIFFLAGAITGHAFWSRHMGDMTCFAKLLALWVCLVLVRVVCLLLSWPLLRWMTQSVFDITWKEIVVMAWGGLRGAVSLCLAIQLLPGDGDVAPSQKDANQAVFYTGGIACLTMVVNAQLAPRLLSQLGVSDATEVQVWAMVRMRRFLAVAGKQSIADVPADALPAQVRRAQRAAESVVARAIWNIGADIKGILPDACRMSINSFAQLATEPPPPPCVHAGKQAGTWRSSLSSGDMAGLTTTIKLTHHGFQDAKWRWLECPKSPVLWSTSAFAGEALEKRTGNASDVLLSERSELNEGRKIYVHASFMGLVRKSYWAMINGGTFGERYQQTRLLLDSVATAASHYGEALGDLGYIFDRLKIYESREDGFKSDHAFPQFSVRAFTCQPLPEQRNLERSVMFSLAVTALASGFAVYRMCFEEAMTDSDEFQVSSAWAFIQGLFCALLLVEVVLRWRACRGRGDDFFEGYVNLFEVLHFVSQTSELALEGLALCFGGFQASRLELRNLNKLLAVCRIYHVLEFYRTCKKNRESGGRNTTDRERLKSRLHNIEVLTSFVEAHVASQEGVLRYFGTDVPEVAYCVAQSGAMVYRALTAIMEQAAGIDTVHLSTVADIKLSCDNISSLAGAIEEAYGLDVIDKKQAELLTGPLERERQRLSTEFGHLLYGRFDREDVLDVVELKTMTRAESTALEIEYEGACAGDLLLPDGTASRRASGGQLQGERTFSENGHAENGHAENGHAENGHCSYDL